MNTTSNTSRIFTWAAFIVIVGLIVWGLIAAQQKADREAAGLVLPDTIVAADHVKGSETAPVTLVEYGDFQCPACGAFYPIVAEALKAGGTNVRFVFRHFPLTQHQNALPAAQASEAAAAQGKFWEMYDVLYTSQEAWATSTDPKTVFTSYAKDLGLDLDKFATDYESKDYKVIISNDYKGGVKAGINSTPTFFVNGKKINPQNYEDFKKIINDAISKPAV